MRDNIVNFDGSKRGPNYESPKKPKKSIVSKLKPEYLGAAIFVLIFVYLVINLYIYYTKEQLSIYEVQAENISYSTVFKGIAVRDEEIVYSDEAGYVNYYIQSGKRVAKDNIVYSVDKSSEIYNTISGFSGELSLDSDEIREIKNVVHGFINVYDEADFGKLTVFNSNISETVFDLINENRLNNVEGLISSGVSSSSLRIKCSNKSGVLSYKSDNLFSINEDGINAEMYEEDFSFEPVNLKVNGLLAENAPVYRICSNEEWKIVMLVTEDFYVNMLEEREVSIYINNSLLPIDGQIRLWQSDGQYYATVTLQKYMTKYIDERYLTVEFCTDDETGYKIPLTAIGEKEFYLVPLSCFSASEEVSGKILLKENYDQTSGEITTEEIYPPKYYSDGYYAYIEKELLNEGDYIINTETGERCKIGLVNTLEGVYCVNKGYYAFVRIEKIKQNDEYCIVRKGVSGSVQLYDHIALNASDAIESSIIY